MQTGAITDYIDVAQLVLYGFWIFFAGLLVYLHRENKREGYPLESERSGRIRVQGFPAIPPPKIFHLRNGGTILAPRPHDLEPPVAAVDGPWPGAPIEPTGDPMRDAVGPAAYALRANEPDLTFDGELKIVPLRTAPDYFVAPKDPDPRGMAVIAADRIQAGVVRDLWIDRGEPQIRFLEVEIAAAPGAGPGGRSVLVPIGFARFERRGRIRVRALTARLFAGVPPVASPDRITVREEDAICAYFAGGCLYAEPARLGPML